MMTPSKVRSSELLGINEPGRSELSNIDLNSHTENGPRSVTQIFTEEEKEFRKK